MLEGIVEGGVKVHRLRQLLPLIPLILTPPLIRKVSNISSRPYRLVRIIAMLLLLLVTEIYAHGYAVDLHMTSPTMIHSSSTPAHAKEPLTIMTFNIRHAQGRDGQIDLNQVAALLRDMDADIIALQEVDRFRRRSAYQDQVQTLATSLQMQWRYAPSVEQGSSQYGNAILSRFPIEQSEFIRLSGERESRSVLETTIRVGPLPLKVVTMHLGVGLADRLNQMPLLLERISSYDGPTVLMGDWNMSAVDPLLQPLTSKWTLLALPIEASTVENGRQIDHIYINYGGIQEEAWTHLTTSSDHKPVLARIMRP